MIMSEEQAERQVPHVAEARAVLVRVLRDLNGRALTPPELRDLRRLCRYAGEILGDALEAATGERQ